MKYKYCVSVVPWSSIFAEKHLLPYNLDHNAIMSTIPSLSELSSDTPLSQHESCSTISTIRYKCIVNTALFPVTCGGGAGTKGERSPGQGLRPRIL